MIYEITSNYYLLLFFLLFSPSLPLCYTWSPLCNGRGVDLDTTEKAERQVPHSQSSAAQAVSLAGKALRSPTSEEATQATRSPCSKETNRLPKLATAQFQAQPVRWRLNVRLSRAALVMGDATREIGLAGAG
jgi:hypothetical protein